MQFREQAPQGQYTSEYTKDIEAPVIRLEIPEKADTNGKVSTSDPAGDWYSRQTQLPAAHLGICQT